MKKKRRGESPRIFTQKSKKYTDMKIILNVAIAIMFFLIACDIETNATRTELNYTTTCILLPVLALSFYAVTHLNEVKKLIK